MNSAKSIHVGAISRSDAERIVKRFHYSGKTVNNSQLHFGVWMDGRLLGAMQYGPSLDKRKVQPLVAGTLWNEFIELNRMAFSDELPRNSESRALAISFKIIKKHYPHIGWVVSYSDATQCGDGAIYRASGFVLTGIKKNSEIWVAPNGKVINAISCRKERSLKSGAASMKQYRERGFVPLEGFQIRYVKFLNKKLREKLTVPELPFSIIEHKGAGMYRGRAKQAMGGDQPPQQRGSTDSHAPTPLSEAAA